jgi:glycerophosphoryl diester phosphodiesterase
MWLKGPQLGRLAPGRNRAELHARLVTALAILGLIGGATFAILRPRLLGDRTAGITRPKQPKLFYEAAGGALLGPQRTFVIAHNGGDSVASAQAAVAYGARAVEIDVAVAQGRLLVSHDRPLPSLGLLPLDAPALEEVWPVASRAGLIALDLKQSSTLLLDPLVGFLREHQNTEVIVSSPRASVLHTLHDEAPWVRRFLSVRKELELTRLRVDPLLDHLQGVAIRQDLLDTATVGWLHDRNLVVVAWVVNDRARLDELVSAGVDGIATDNLAIVELLRAQHDETSLAVLED